MTLRTQFGDIAMDLIHFSEAFNGHLYLLHAYDLETCLHVVESDSNKNQPVLLRFFHSLNQFVRALNRNIRILHTDLDSGIGLTFRSYLAEQGIQQHPTPPYTPDLDPAERPGGVLVTMARAMRIAANLPERL